MRWIFVSVILIVLIIGTSCQNNPIEESPTATPAAIVLSTNYPSLEVGGEASMVFAYILAEDGDTLGAGYPIRFEIVEAPATSGPGSPSFEYIATADSVLLEVAAVTNSEGRASTIFYSGTEAGDVMIRAAYVSNEEISVSEHLITIMPAETIQLILSIAYYSIPHGGASILIHASILDDEGIPISDGHEVLFEITEAPSWTGEDSPSLVYPSSDDSALYAYEAYTEDGVASVSLYSGNLPGMVRIRVSTLYDEESYSDSAQIAITANTMYYIELSAADSAIEVGGNTTTVYANLMDWHGEPAGEGYEIKLEIIDSHYGHPVFILPGDENYDTILIDTTDTDGQVGAEMLSDARRGPVVVRATALFDDSIYTEEPVVMILAGPAHYISIMPSAVPEAEGEAIRMGVAAAVWDQFTNPVEPLTRVDFELLPDTFGYIESPAYTGGWIDPESGDTIGVRGLAQTSMIYSCYHTFDTVRIIVAADTIVDTSEAIVLAIYNGQLEVTAQPDSLIIQAPDTIAYADLEAQLLDGLGCPIHNGVINFTAQVCGEISGPFTDTTDINGYAHTEFMIRAADIPENYPDPPQCTAIIKARLRGYPDVQGECQLQCIINQ